MYMETHCVYRQNLKGIINWNNLTPSSCVQINFRPDFFTLQNFFTNFIREVENYSNQKVENFKVENFEKCRMKKLLLQYFVMNFYTSLRLERNFKIYRYFLDFFLFLLDFSLLSHEFFLFFVSGLKPINLLMYGTACVGKIYMYSQA